MTAPEPKAVQDYYPDDFAHLLWLWATEGI